RMAGSLAAPRYSAQSDLLFLFSGLLPSNRRQAKRSLHRLVIVDHRRLITAIDQMGLRSRRQAKLDTTPGREILPRHHLEDQLHILVPVGVLLVCFRRL